MFVATFGARRITPQKLVIILFVACVVLATLWVMVGRTYLSNPGIDVSKAKELTFGDLARCTDPEAPPPELAELNGKLVKIVGYMQPVYGGERVRKFMLIPVPPRAKKRRKLSPNEIVVVALEPGSSVALLDKPVEIVGEFRTGPPPREEQDELAADLQDGAFFRILAFIVHPAKD